MRAIAILAVYNEARYIGNCLEHLFAHGVDAYLIDNESSDDTVAIAERHLGRGLVGIETFPRTKILSLRALLARKEELAMTLDADWFMHMDADEIRLPPRSGQTLMQFFADAEAQHCNAVNFMEFTFIPVREEPDHDHARYLQTMRHYYPFAPAFPHRVTAWKRQPERIDLAGSGGHLVRFPGRRRYAHSGMMRHYLFLSAGHFLSKYQRNYDVADVRKGWHGWRAHISAGSRVQLPPGALLRTWQSDDELDFSNPLSRHFAESWVGR